MMKKATLYTDVVGNFGSKNFLQGYLTSAETGKKFIILQGKAGHGKSFLAGISSRLYLCEAVDPTMKEPCNKCTSCLNIMNNVTTPYFRSINLGDSDNKSFIEDFRNETQKITDSKAVILLEELHRLEDKQQGAMMDIIDKANADIMMIATTNRLYGVLDTVRDRSVILGVGLNSNEIAYLLDNLCNDLGYPPSVAKYLKTKHMSPRMLESILVTHKQAGMPTLAAIQEHLREPSKKEVYRLVESFVQPFELFSKRVADFPESFGADVIKSICESALRELTGVLCKRDLNGGRKGADYKEDFLLLVNNMPIQEIYILIHYIQELSKIENDTEVFSVKYKYERALGKCKEDFLTTMNRSHYKPVPEKPAVKVLTEAEQADLDMKKTYAENASVAHAIVTFGSCQAKIPQASAKGVDTDIESKG